MAGSSARVVPAPTVTRTRAGEYWVLGAICLAPFVGFLLATALSPFFAVIAPDLHTSVALLGQIPAVSMLLAAGLGLLIGPLADFYGLRRMLLLGTLVVVASAVGTALAPSFAILLLATLLAAASRAIIQPVALALTGTQFRDAAQQRAISWVVAAAAGAPIVGVPFLTAIGAAFGWRSAFGALAVVALGVTAMVAWVLPADPARTGRRPAARSVLAAYVPLLRHASTVGVVGSSLLRSAAAWGWFTYFGAYLVQVKHLSVQQAGWGYTLVGLGFFAGSLLAGGRLGHLPPRALLIGTAVIQGVVMAVPIVLGFGVPAVLALNCLGAAMMGSANVTGTFLLARESPAGRATTMTLNQAAFSVGSAAGSAIGGLLLAVSGYTAIAVSVPCFCLAAAVMVWLCQSRDTMGEETVPLVEAG